MEKYERLKTSERNKIIQAYRDGKPDPNYDVIPSKNQPGKYTIRKKLAENAPEKPGTGEKIADANTETLKDISVPEKQETDNNIISPEPIEEEPYDDEYFMPKMGLSKAGMFREMQLQLNKMMLEQLKILRRDQKATEKKRKKYAAKSKKIHNVLSSIAYNEEQIPQEPEPNDIEEKKAFFEKKPEKEEEIPDNINIEVEDFDPDAQPYDNQLNQMLEGPRYISRRDRLKAFI
jgi:hypothetical protein